MSEADDITRALLEGTLGVAEHGLAEPVREPFVPSVFRGDAATTFTIGFEPDDDLWSASRMYMIGDETVMYRATGPGSWQEVDNPFVPREFIGELSCGSTSFHGAGEWGRLRRRRGFIGDDGAWRPNRLRFHDAYLRFRLA